MHRSLFALALSVPMLQAQSHAVPMTLEGNSPIVELSTSRVGKPARPAKFLIDTAGGSIVIGSRLMQDIAAQPAGREITERGQRYVPLKPFAIALAGAALKLEGTRILGVLESERPLARADVEGVLPASFLRNYRVAIDYPGRTFELSAPGKTPGRGIAVKTPIHPESGFPRLEARVAGSTFGFLLDTASSFTTVSRALLNQWTAQNPRWPRSLGAVGYADMFGGETENDAMMVRLPELQIDSLKIDRPAVISRPQGEYEQFLSAQSTGAVVGAIAGNILRDFRVEIDYQNGVTYLERSDKEAPENDLTAAGLVLGVDTGKGLLVTGFSSNASLDVPESVLSGDRLLEVDGSSMEGASLAAAALTLSGEAGSKKTLTLEREGQRVKVTVAVSPLLPRELTPLPKDADQ